MHSPILAPLVALVLWSFVMWAWLYATRIPAIVKIRQHDCFALPRIRPPDRAFVLSEGRNKANIHAGAGGIRESPGLLT